MSLVERPLFGLPSHLRLCSRFINLPRIISANPTTRECHVPGGLPYRSNCNPPRLIFFWPPAQQVKALATALMSEGNPGRGICQRERRSTKTVHPPIPRPPAVAISGVNFRSSPRIDWRPWRILYLYVTCPAAHVIDGLDVIGRQYLTKSFMDLY